MRSVACVAPAFRRIDGRNPAPAPKKRHPLLLNYLWSSTEMADTDTVIYKVTTRALWKRGEAEAYLPYSPVDENDGFMHFSTADQLRETLRLHFAGQGDLILCAVPVAAIAANLQWEPSRGGALFPHLHAELPMSAIDAHHSIAVDADGNTTLPGGIA